MFLLLLCIYILYSFDFTFLLTIGCTVGALFTLYLLYRAYRLLLLTYCVSLSRQTDDQPAVFVLPRARIEGVLGRLQEYRKGDTPPPPYDSPPPYHVAIVMGTVPDLLVSDPVMI